MLIYFLLIYKWDQNLLEIKKIKKIQTNQLYTTIQTNQLYKKIQINQLYMKIQTNQLNLNIQYLIK